MSKGYKKEYIDKVKQKFNDLQTTNKRDSNDTGKQQNAAYSKVCKSSRVVKLG